MRRSQLSLLCVSLLVWSSLASASGASRPPEAPKQSLKYQVTQIPQGAVVDARLFDKTKIRGQLGSISDSAFDLRYTRDGKVVTETLAFENVRSVKMVRQGWGTGEKVAVGVLIGLGVFIVAIIALFATHPS